MMGGLSMGGRGGYFECERPGQIHGSNCQCIVAYVEAERMSGIVNSADTTFVQDTATSGTPSESGSEESRQSRSGSGRTRARRSVPVTTPPDSAPPDLEAEAEALLGDKKKLYALLKKELLVAYLMECRAGKDANANPQHSRASRKQAKELAELLARLTNDSEK